MATDTASSKPRQTAAIVRARLQDLSAGARRVFPFLRDAGFLRPPRTMARLRGCGHVPLRRDCGLGHRAAQFAAICNRRARQLDLGRHGRVRRRIPRADYRRGRDRTSLGACDHRHGAQYRPHWSGAACPWRFSCRPGDTFCSLSGGRRVPRGDRMAHRHGRRASGDGSASHGRDRGWAFSTC